MKHRPTPAAGHAGQTRTRGLLHFDAHLDTWDNYLGSRYTHGTSFRRAAEEGLSVPGHSMHVGVRAPLYSPRDLEDDAALGFATIGTWETDDIGIGGVVERIREHVAGLPVYLSIDIDVLDPAFAQEREHRRSAGSQRVSSPPSCGGCADCRSSVSTWWRWRPLTTTPRSRRSPQPTSRTMASP